MKLNPPRGIDPVEENLKMADQKSSGGNKSSGSGNSSNGGGKSSGGGSRSASSGSDNKSSSGTQGGSREQHAEAGRQSHKNDK